MQLKTKMFYRKRGYKMEEKMVSAQEFYQRIDFCFKEQEALKNRILAVYNGDWGNFDSESRTIVSPFKAGYTIKKRTEEWLSDFGWQMEEDRIVPIVSNLIPKNSSPKSKTNSEETYLDEENSKKTSLPKDDYEGNPKKKDSLEK